MPLSVAVYVERGEVAWRRARQRRAEFREEWRSAVVAKFLAERAAVLAIANFCLQKWQLLGAWLPHEILAIILSFAGLSDHLQVLEPEHTWPHRSTGEAGAWQLARNLRLAQLVGHPRADPRTRRLLAEESLALREALRRMVVWRRRANAEQRHWHNVWADMANGAPMLQLANPARVIAISWW